MKLLITFLLSLMMSLNSAAHTDEYLDSQPSPHGGQVRMVGNYHFELVLGDHQLLVYVTDHAGQPIAVAGATGSAMVLANKTKTTVTLKPAEDNILKGEGKFTTAPDMKVVVSMTLPGQDPQQVRFTPLQKKSATPKSDSAEHVDGGH